LAIRVCPSEAASGILLGFAQKAQALVPSRAAVDAFLARIEPVLRAGESVWLQVAGAAPDTRAMHG
jgi:hypothetical protein